MVSNFCVCLFVESVWWSYIWKNSWCQILGVIDVVMIHSFKGLIQTIFYVFLLNRTMASCDLKSILFVLFGSIMSNCISGEFGTILQKKGKRKCTLFVEFGCKAETSCKHLISLHCCHFWTNFQLLRVPVHIIVRFYCPSMHVRRKVRESCECSWVWGPWRRKIAHERVLECVDPNNHSPDS